MQFGGKRQQKLRPHKNLNQFQAQLRAIDIKALIKQCLFIYTHVTHVVYTVSVCVTTNIDDLPPHSQMSILLARDA